MTANTSDLVQGQRADKLLGDRLVQTHRGSNESLDHVCDRACVRKPRVVYVRVEVSANR